MSRWLCCLLCIAQTAQADRPCRTAERTIDLGLARRFGAEPASLELGPAGSQFAVFLDDAQGSFGNTIACGPTSTGDAALYSLYLEYLELFATDAQFMTVFLTSPSSCSGSGGPVFYLPMFNDVHGIGYQHSDKRQVFDETPDQDLEGMIFLNDIPYWNEHPEELVLTFQQEVGHRWGASVHADFGQGSSSDLLGRANVHWSYFLQTDASPLEGNRWIDQGDGTFSTATEPDDFHFFGLDLYLMGLIPPKEVKDTFLLVDVEADGQADCFGGAIRSSSPPQFCQPVTISANALPVSIDHVVAAEGARDPAYPDTPRQFTMATVLIMKPDDLAIGPAGCEEIDTDLGVLTGTFSEATGDRAALVVSSQGLGSCDKWQEFDPPDDGCGCALSSVDVNMGVDVNVIVFVLVFVLLRARADNLSRHKGVPCKRI